MRRATIVQSASLWNRQAGSASSHHALKPEATAPQHVEKIHNANMGLARVLNSEFAFDWFGAQILTWFFSIADTGLSHGAQVVLSLGVFLGAATVTAGSIQQQPALVKKTSSAKWKAAREGPVGNPISLQ
jgi:hypothetical protein